MTGMETKTIYITIGNTDNKLTQQQWAQLWAEVDNEIRFSIQDLRPIIHGAWASNPVSQYQNACWCVELAIGLEMRLKRVLSLAARTWGQDSIFWAEVIDVDFIKPHQ